MCAHNSVDTQLTKGGYYGITLGYDTSIAGNSFYLNEQIGVYI